MQKSARERSKQFCEGHYWHGLNFLATHASLVLCESSECTSIELAQVRATTVKKVLETQIFEEMGTCRKLKRSEFDPLKKDPSDSSV